MSQEKLQAKNMQNVLGGGGGVQEVHYGIVQVVNISLSAHFKPLYGINMSIICLKKTLYHYQAFTMYLNSTKQLKKLFLIYL